MPVVAFARANWRWIVAALGLLTVAAIWLYVDHLRHVVVVQKAKAQVAVQQAKVQTVATQAVSNLATQTVQVEERTHVIVKTIHDAPGADSPVPDAVLSAWRAGLRDEADPAH